MKRRLKQILGLSALFIGALSASAQDNYGYASFDLSNSVPIFHVYGLPYPINEITNVEVYVDDSDIYTDTSGKISGYALMYIATYSDVVTTVTNILPSIIDTNVVITLETNSVQNVESYNFCRVSGKLGTKGADAVVRLSVKGSGASATKTATGTSKFSASFAGTSATNIFLGSYKAKFSTGIKGVKGLSLKDIPSRLTNCNGSPWVEDCDLYVYQAGNKLFSFGGTHFGGYHYDFQGSGSYKNGEFKLKLNGVEYDRGIKFTLSGNAEGSLSGTNYISLTALTAKGKAVGQKINTLPGTGAVYNESIMTVESKK